MFIRHGECPTPENTETFIRVCEHFSDKNPSELIGMSSFICFHYFFPVNLYKPKNFCSTVFVHI